MSPDLLEPSGAGRILTQDIPISPALLEEAIDWFLLIKARPDCPETEADFQAWIGRSPMHAIAWSRALNTWQRLGEVPPANAHLWPGGQPRQSAPAAPLEQRTGKSVHRRLRAAAVATLGLAACALAVLFAPGLLLRLQADHITDIAETRKLTLEDGTVVELAGGSAIATTMTTEKRSVMILAGEAFFDVSHDASRPFTVTAGGVAITVLGTAFDVQLSDDATTVELARGHVAISYRTDAKAENFELSPGEMAAVEHGTGNVARSAIAPEDIAVWRTGKMFVNDVSVAAAIERLQRYHPAWIAIPDRALAQRHVTGLYDLKDPDSALEALIKPFGGRVRAVTPYGRVLTRF